MKNQKVGKILQKQLQKSSFSVELQPVGLQIYKKLASPQIFYSDFARIRIILLPLISKNLITTIFKEHLSTDASECCKS